MRKILTAIFTFALAGSLAAQTGTTQKSTTAKPATSKPATGTAAVPAKQPILAVFQTTAGDINCTLFPDKAPVTVDTFVGLATGTKDWKNPSNGATMHNRPLYDGTIFHRVIPNFMIQGGDPLGNGTGSPGFTFKDEFSDLRFDQPGRLAMANSGPNTNGSQFFITEVPTPHLDGKHTIFGQCENLDLVKQIARTPSDPRNDRPFTPVKITHLKIVNPNKPAAATPAKKPATTTGSKSSTTTQKPSSTTPKPQ
jgi:cyclophilin family peptidyl-prolyl cis-trans isomerase